MFDFLFPLPYHLVVAQWHTLLIILPVVYFILDYSLHTFAFTLSRRLPLRYVDGLLSAIADLHSNVNITIKLTQRPPYTQRKDYHTTNIKAKTAKQEGIICNGKRHFSANISLHIYYMYKQKEISDKVFYL